MGPRALSLLLAAAWGTCAWPQISPGELSRPHERLEGNRRCGECHDAARGVDRGKCLGCHRLLGERVRAGRGLHAGAEYRPCERCHIEHHGRDFELIWWGDVGVEGFDHAATGTPLAGAHTEVGCRDCHRAAHVTDPDRLTARRKDLDRTYLGLVGACGSCHANVHGGASECLGCHTVKAWKPAAAFDHADTDYPLRGRHVDVACVRCHPGDPLRFGALPHGDCLDCHEDPHAGQFSGKRCDACHEVAGFSPATRFDHRRSAYPLTGRHRFVDCSLCHRARYVGLAFGSCSDCHADPHEGRLGADCADCHETAGWERVERGRFDHDGTRYPLRGAHRRLGCERCHPVAGTHRVSRFSRCADCHDDAHAGQFAERAGGGACEACHTVERFVPSTFTASAHAATSYPLAGAHRAVACGACHDGGRYRFPEAGCPDCHRDPHGDTPPGRGCTVCHRVEGWSRVTFEHGDTRFALEGAHRGAGCRECHRARGFAGLSRDCVSCHADPHGGQFDTGSLRADCGRCHATADWSAPRFDHDRDAAFPLRGEHRGAACAGCHPAERIDGRDVVRYRPRPRTCGGCHGLPRRPAAVLYAE